MARRRPVFVAQPRPLNPIEFDEYAVPKPAVRADKTQSDILDDVQRGAGSAIAGLGSALRDVYEPAGKWLEETGTEIVRNNPADYANLSDIKGLGDLFGFGVERIAEMAPQLVGAGAASVLGTPAAGLAVMAGTTGATTYGEARAAQREAGVEDKTRAALAALPAAALDVFGVGRVVPGAGRFLGEVFEGGLRGAGKAAARVGAEEAGTEVLQTGLQRFGGYQELTSPEAVEEYKFAALAGGLAGGALGGGRGYFGGAEPAAEPGALPPQPAFREAGPLIPPEAPAGIAEAPAIRTIELPSFTEEGGEETVALSVLSEPDEGGNVWVRTPEGRVTSMPEPFLRRMAGEPMPEPMPETALAPVVEEPTPAMGEAPGTFRTTTEINGVPVTVVGETPTLQTPEAEPAPEQAPLDILPPEPVPVTEIAPEAPPAPSTVPPLSVEGVPEAPAPEVLPLPEAAPIDVTPEAPEVAPVEGPAAVAEAPEQYIFTPEKAQEVSSYDPTLAKDLIGKTVSGGAEVLAQRTKSPFYRQMANRVAGVARAMEGAGIRMPIGITNVPGGQGMASEGTMRAARRPNTGGVTNLLPPLEGGPYTAFEVGMKGKPTKTVPRGANEQTLLHEMLHSVTTGAQRMADKFPSNSRMGQALKDIKKLHGKVLDGVRDIKTGKIKVGDDVKMSILRLENTNAFLNERELLAWGMTDYDMQNVLKAIPTKQGNAFTEFVAAVAKMLGVGPKDYNALRELIELTEVAIPTDVAAQQEMIGVVTGKIGEEAAPIVEPEVETVQDVSEEQVPTPETAPEVEAEAETAAPSPAEDEAGRPVIQYSLGDETRGDRYRRIWVDKMRRLGFVEEAIQKSLGRPLSRAERTSEKAALFEGRADTRLKELEQDHINKIIEVLKKENIPPEKADLFLLARAAPARNAKIAKRNPDMPDGGSGMTNDVAQQIMLDTTLAGDMPKMLRMAAAVDAMTKATRDRMVEYGLISKKQAEALEREEPYYVPLKGNSVDGDISTMGDETFNAPGTGRGFSVTRKEYLAAKGRMSMPFSPLATAMNDAQDVIVRGERNRVGQSFLNDIAKKYDSNAWQVFTDEKPDMTVQYVQKDNKVRAVPVNMAANAKQYFVVKENGKPYYIKINDPILMRALTNGSTEQFSAINKFLGNTIGKVTRALSQLHTTLNPEFVVPNILRDVEAAVFNLAAEQDAVDGRLAGQKIIKGVLKDIKSWDNLKRLYKATFNHEATTAEQKQISALFQQAKEDGAFTGWILYSTPEEQMAKIKDELDRVSATGKKKLWYSTRDGAKRVIERIQDLNSVAENVTRFSVYKNALEAFTASGMSEADARDQAANMARNVTVDFNRKGEAGPTANAFYAFFNASVQGNVQLLRSLYTARTPDGKRTRAQKMAMGLLGLGLLMTMVNRGMSEEDEDGMLFYDKIPDWEKERNMVLMLPGGKEYLKIPMPYGYSIFHNIGSMISDMAYGNKTPADAAVGLFSGLVNNFSPVPVSGQSLKGVAASMVPTAMRPFADLAINENFFGSPIYNEPFDENQAQSSVSRFSTPEGYKAVVEFLNEATGGKGRVAGAVDLPAESLEYLMNYYVGGAGKFLGKLMDWGKKLGTGEEITARDVPLFNKVLGEPNNQNDLGLYYDRINEISPVERQLRNSFGQERRDLMEKFPVETDPRVIAGMKQAKQQLKEANQVKRNLLDRDMDDAVRQERLDKLNERIHNIYLKFNDTYNKAKEREG